MAEVSWKSYDDVNKADIVKYVDKRCDIKTHDGCRYIGEIVDVIFEDDFADSKFMMNRRLENDIRVDDDVVHLVSIKSINIVSEDMVNNPIHYQSATGLEVIDVVEAFTDGLNGIEATDTGNVIKYICRWNHKNGLEDLKKAQWYLNHLINHIEEKEKKKQ